MVDHQIDRSVERQAARLIFVISLDCHGGSVDHEIDRLDGDNVADLLIIGLTEIC